MTVLADVGRLKHISPSRIVRNPENPRLIFRQEEMDSLMLSIDKYGIQVPLSVYEQGDHYVLIDGERRWKCAVKLNLKVVPALVHAKPNELENLLMMYNIHALMEQWDYFTIASKLERIIELYEVDEGRSPTEAWLSEATGLSRGQIRRCRLLIDLPSRFKRLLLDELHKPKPQQRLSEDFFIEMERALKTVTGRLPEYAARVDEIRGTLVDKYLRRDIEAVTDFRQLAKIATAVDTLDVARQTAKRALDSVFDARNRTGIRAAFERAVEFSYDAKKAMRNVVALSDFLGTVLQGDPSGLDEELLAQMKHLKGVINQILRALHE